MPPAPIGKADRTRKKNYWLTVPGQHHLLAEGDIGAPIYWRTDVPCLRYRVPYPVHPARFTVLAVERDTPCTFILLAGAVVERNTPWTPTLLVLENLKRGAPNSLVRLAYFHTNRLLIELCKQETEIQYVAEKTTATLKSKQTSIATVRYPILTVACFPTLLLFHYPLPLKVHKREQFLDSNFEFCPFYCYLCINIKVLQKKSFLIGPLLREIRLFSLYWD